MKLQNRENMTALVLQLITTVDEYYDCSFKIRNDRCFVILLKLIGQVESLLETMQGSDRQSELMEILNQIANAMANKDYVLIRDLLHYELRSKLHTLKN